MLSEPDASRSGKSGLVSSAKRRYLKLVIGSVHLWKERNGVRRCGLVQTEERRGRSSEGGFYETDDWFETSNQLRRRSL